MSIRIEAGLRTLVLALYDEAALTAAAKGLTGTLGHMAALRETASLASAPARRTVSEEEVMRVLLAARRTRRAILLPDHALPGVPGSGPADAALSGASLRLRRGRLAAWAMRSLSRPGAALV
ncbi:hypothetical protein [Azospirillum doebereinerae]